MTSALCERGSSAGTGAGRRALRAARRRPTAENLHEWRKRAKDHWYNLSVLRDVWPPVMEPLADAAHQLSERLGEDHDLEVLLDFARSHATGPDGADLVAALTGVVESRREELRGRGLRPRRAALRREPAGVRGPDREPLAHLALGRRRIAGRHASALLVRFP